MVELLSWILNNLNLISIIAFYSIIAFLIYKNKHKIQRVFKVVFLYRTKRGLKTINWLGRYGKFWRGFGYLSVVVGYLGMVVILGLLIKSLYDSITQPAAPAGVSIVIPGVTTPFWYGIIAIALLVLVHEGAHGVVARAHGIRVKNTGIGLAAILPLAFVEPDEKQLSNKPARVQISVFAAGSMANFCLAGLAILLGTFLIFPAASTVTHFDGLEVVELVEGFPAELAGIQPGSVITSVNGVQLESTQTLVDQLEEVAPGDEIALGVDEEELAVTAAANPDDRTRPYIGVSFAPKVSLDQGIEAKYWKFPWLLVYFSSLLLWVFFFNIGIGMFNLLPIAIVDGGRMAQVGLRRVVKNQTVAHKLFVYLTLFALSLLLLNLFSPLLF